MNAMAERNDKIARSPKVLAPLIEEQVELGQQAGVAFYKEAGALLLEARESITDLRLWHRYIVARGITPSQGKYWMRLARSERLGLGHRSLDAASRDPRTRSKPGQYQPRRTSDEQSRQAAEPMQEQRRADFRAERRAQRAEMLLLISAGYKQLATKRHPDAGGSHNAMVLLKECRDLLLKYAEAWK